MKKKKKVLTAKQIIIILSTMILGFIVIVSLSLSVTKRIKNQNIQTEYEINQELTSIKQVVEYLESRYYYEEKSNTNGYDLDIYLSFKYNLYENDKSEEIYFTNFYEKIAAVTKNNSFRLIDTEKNIIIEVKCSSSRIFEVKINGEENYFKNENSRRSKKNELTVDTIELTADSSVLKRLIDSSWIVSNSNVGIAESRYNKYDIYFDEGYEIKTIKGKVYNIVFNKKYNEKIAGGFKVGDDLERIEANIGTSYKSLSLLGYKTKDYYIYFSKDQISIYPRYKSDYSEFEKLVKEYDKNKNINDFADKLTDIWPDYDKYTYDSNFFEIRYTVKGVAIHYSSSNPQGIQIYENYEGALKDEKTDYKDVYYKLNENLIIQAEKERLMNDSLYDNSRIEEDPLHYSHKFFLSMKASDMFYNKIKIIALDKNYPNNEFDEEITIYTYIWGDDTHLIYSIYNDGIYLYDAENRSTEKLLSGKEEFKIIDYDRDTNIMKYDNKEVKISF